VTLECVVNVSEGRDSDTISLIATAAGPCLIDLHSDGFHNRSVCTLADVDHEALLAATLELAGAALDLIDLRRHLGVHPRLGAVDVVPFVPVGDPPFELGEALALRDAFAARAASELGLPCFLYGPERSLPEVRRGAFTALAPDLGPRTPDPRHGACCVGARPPLVAYNIVLAEADLALARRVAAALRGPRLRTLAFAVGEEVQVSCNLVAPFELGPAEAVDACAAHAVVARSELVGLVPAGVLAAVPRHRWAELDLDEARTIESRLAHRPRAGSGPA